MREQDEYDGGHIPNAILIPYTEINDKAATLLPDKEKQTQLERLGVPNTLLNAIHLELGEKAAAGDVQAAKYLRDTAMTQPCGKENGSGADGFDLSALTDKELKAIAAQAAEEK